MKFNIFIVAIAINLSGCYTYQPLTYPPRNNTGRNYSDIVTTLTGAKIFAQDENNTYLGKISNSFDSESIFNEFGNYGNEFSPNSIWNEFSTFGNEFNGLSPFNEFCSNPPMIIKNGKIIAYLTTNNTIIGAISPNILKALKDQF